MKFRKVTEIGKFNYELGFVCLIASQIILMGFTIFYMPILNPPWNYSLFPIGWFVILHIVLISVTILISLKKETYYEKIK